MKHHKSVTPRKQIVSPWECAKATEIIIRRIRRDASYQVRRKLDQVTVKRYVGVFLAEKEMPPIKVALVNDVPHLVDGWHRLAALEQIGRTATRAMVIETTEREAKWLAASANMEHGLALKPGEVRAVFRAFVRARKHRNARGVLLSYREIGFELGKPHTTVRNWMMKDFPKVAAEYGSMEEFKGKGGLTELPVLEPSMREAAEALHRALSTFRTTDYPQQRGAILQLAEGVLQEMKEAGNWEAIPF
ncbi:hypothetical protein CN120_02335 [Sinorhizobium meliloti]|uniref:ParB N-terminal domain-containing protein n=1 Tax=Rhizobium meliloti TaxID=382 RepID=UPI000FD76859|nr:ParB N-terminal domain-containing protein [Sinorhizobium meliloti]RVN11146.1 hypothetical protein CN120_02335 [Sinorhizobium meliloti]